MKVELTTFRSLGAAVVMGCVLTACNDDVPDEQSVAPVQKLKEPDPVEQPESKETKTVRGVLKHFPQDVKSEEAWLGREFAVGETTIRTTDKVSSEELMKLVGEIVEIEGVWNPGKTYEPPKPTDEDFFTQRPTYPDFAKVIVGSGIEATSVKKVEP